MIAAYKIHAEAPLPELTIENIYPEVYLHKSYQRVEGFGLVSLNGLVVVEGRRAIQRNWPDSVGKVLSKYPDAQIVIPGHGKPEGFRLLERTGKLPESAASVPPD